MSSYHHHTATGGSLVWLQHIRSVAASRNVAMERLTEAKLFELCKIVATDVFGLSHNDALLAIQHVWYGLVVRCNVPDERKAIRDRNRRKKERRQKAQRVGVARLLSLRCGRMEPSENTPPALVEAMQRNLALLRKWFADPANERDIAQCGGINFDTVEDALRHVTSPMIFGAVLDSMLAAYCSDVSAGELANGEDVADVSEPTPDVVTENLSCVDVVCENLSVVDVVDDPLTKTFPLAIERAAAKFVTWYVAQLGGLHPERHFDADTREKIIHDVMVRLGRANPNPNMLVACAIRRLGYLRPQSHASLDTEPVQTQPHVNANSLGSSSVDTDDERYDAFSAPSLRGLPAPDDLSLPPPLAL